jgi:hypothetical protein
MTKINIYFDIMHNNVRNHDNYVIWIFKKIQYIFDSKNNKGY